MISCICSGTHSRTKDEGWRMQVNNPLPPSFILHSDGGHLASGQVPF